MNLLREAFKKLNVYKIKKRILKYKIQKVEKNRNSMLKYVYMSKWVKISS